MKIDGAKILSAVAIVLSAASTIVGTAQMKCEVAKQIAKALKQAK